jgi:hypothetical protein
MPEEVVYDGKRAKRLKIEMRRSGRTIEQEAKQQKVSVFEVALQYKGFFRVPKQELVKTEGQ